MDGEGLHFYYNRERRLARAGKRVRALYEAPPGKPTLLSSLTDSKPKAAMFTVIAAMCLLILFFTYIAPAKSTSLGGNSVELSAMRGGGSTFIVLKKAALKKNAYTGIVSVQTTGASPGGARQHNGTVVFSALKDEEFRWTLPFEAATLKVFLQAGADSMSAAIRSRQAGHGTAPCPPPARETVRQSAISAPCHRRILPLIS